jgi:radical SAM protein with 4Fe4S-binding SPASM domain
MKKNDFTVEYLSPNKIYSHLDRVKELLDTGGTLPIMMEIDPTNDCIHNCPNCYYSGNRFTDASLTLDFMKKVIDQTSPFLKSVVFTGGGEPLCNPVTIAAIRYAYSKKLSVALITNGGLIDKENAKDIVKYCEWVRISIDAYDEKDYLNTHGMDKKHLEKVWKNIGLLAKANKRSNKKCTIGVAFLVNKQNRKNMFLFAKKAKKVGVDYCQFRPFHFSKLNFLGDLDKPKKLEDDKFKVIASMQRIVKVEGDFSVCLGDHLRTVLAADGYLYPCCFTRGHKQFRLGNLAKNDFMSIWKSERKDRIFKNKLSTPDAPYLQMCRLDYLNKLLWTLYKIKNLKHINFV